MGGGGERQFGERVKAGFFSSIHTGVLVISELKYGDGSERGMCVSVDCSLKTCVRWVFLLSLSN